jgi:hypothetical protein
MIGAQASNEQLEKILSYFDIGRQEGAEVLTGGSCNEMPGDLARGYYVKPTVLKGHNEMRIFQEEILRPVVSVTTFKDDDEALSIANDTLYGLGAGIWNRDANRLYRFGRAIQAGRVWTNCYHAYPAHVAFGGYKQSGIGRETHMFSLDNGREVRFLTRSRICSPDRGPLQSSSCPLDEQYRAVPSRLVWNEPSNSTEARGHLEKTTYEVSENWVARAHVDAQKYRDIYAFSTSVPANFGSITAGEST